LVNKLLGGKICFFTRDHEWSFQDVWPEAGQDYTGAIYDRQGAVQLPQCVGLPFFD
jgi:hypothetical protein